MGPTRFTVVLTAMVLVKKCVLLIIGFTRTQAYSCTALYTHHVMSIINTHKFIANFSSLKVVLYFKLLGKS